MGWEKKLWKLAKQSKQTVQTGTIMQQLPALIRTSWSLVACLAPPLFLKCQTFHARPATLRYGMPRSLPLYAQLGGCTLTFRTPANESSPLIFSRHRFNRGKGSWPPAICIRPAAIAYNAGPLTECCCPGIALPFTQFMSGGCPLPTG